MRLLSAARGQTRSGFSRTECARSALATAFPSELLPGPNPHVETDSLPVVDSRWTQLRGRVLFSSNAARVLKAVHVSGWSHSVARATGCQHLISSITDKPLICVPPKAHGQARPFTATRFMMALTNAEPIFRAGTDAAKNYSADAAARREKLLTLALELYADGKDPLSLADGIAKKACVGNTASDWARDHAAQRAVRGARKRCRTLAQASVRVKARIPCEQDRYTWALIRPAVARAIQQGQSWRAVVSALPPDRVGTQSLYTFEKRIVARFGLKMVDAYASVERAARHLELSHVGEGILARAWVEQRGAQALADEPRHALVAERMQLCEEGRLGLERLCARSVGMERVAAGHSCTEAARELGLDPYFLDLLRKHVALSMGVQRLHAAAGGPVDVDDLDLGPDWTAALRAVGQASRSVARNALPAVAMRR